MKYLRSINNFKSVNDQVKNFGKILNENLSMQWIPSKDFPKHIGILLKKHGINSQNFDNIINKSFTTPDNNHYQIKNIEVLPNPQQTYPMKYKMILLVNDSKEGIFEFDDNWLKIMG